MTSLGKRPPPPCLRYWWVQIKSSYVFILIPFYSSPPSAIKCKFFPTFLWKLFLNILYLSYMCVRHIIDIKGVPGKKRKSVFLRIFNMDITIMVMVINVQVLQIKGYLLVYIYSYCLFWDTLQSASLKDKMTALEQEPWILRVLIYFDL